jgi:hypothetical protein
MELDKKFDRKVDLDINCRVRRIMVRHWIDLGKISMRTTRCVVTLNGSLMRQPHISPEVDLATPGSILDEIKRIPEVRRLQINLDNWNGQSIDDKSSGIA